MAIEAGSISAYMDLDISSFKKNLAQAASEISAFAEIGNHAGQGFIDGLESKISLSYNAGLGIAKAAERGAKAALDINSPSRVFMEIGRFSVMGMAEGFKDNAYLVTYQMQMIKDSIMNTGNAISTGLIQVDELTSNLIYSNTFQAYMDKTDIYFSERDQRVFLMSEGTEENIAQIEREIDATRNAYDIKIKLYEQEMYAKLALIDGESGEQIAELKKQIDDINKLNEEDRKKEAAIRYEEQLAEKERAFNRAATVEERQKLYLSLEEFKRKREKELLREQRKEEQDALRDQIEDIKNKAQVDKDALKNEFEAKKYQLEQQSIAENNYLMQMQETLKVDFDKRKELEEIHTKIKGTENKKRTEGEIKELKTREKELTLSINKNKSTLQNFTADVDVIGQEYGRLLLDGFKSTESELIDYLDSIKERAEATRRAVASASSGEKKSYSFEKYSSKMMNLARDNADVMRMSGNYNSEGFGVYELPFKKEATEVFIDYEKLSDSIARKIKPNVTMNNEFTSPKALSEADIKRNTEILMREMAFLL